MPVQELNKNWFQKANNKSDNNATMLFIVKVFPFLCLLQAQGMWNQEKNFQN